MGIEVTGRRGRRRRELLDDLEERGVYFEEYFKHGAHTQVILCTDCLNTENPTSQQIISTFRIFIRQFALRQVQSLSQSQLSTQCDLELPPSNDSILSFP